jgi:dihydrofolate reductase
MGNVSFGMLMSVDGYVAGPPGGPQLPMFGDELHRHFNEGMRATALFLCGRELYTTMRYWDDDDDARSDAQADFATAWRDTPKVVVSTTLSDVGPNASLVSDDVDAELRRIVEKTEGEIDVGGPTLAATLGRLGLVDEYRVYTRPTVLGGGKPLFAAGTSIDLRLLDVEKLPDDTVLLRYEPVG